MKRQIFALSTISAVLIALSVAAFADSHVRIVRLSSVEGTVQMDRAGQGLERAILNAPIVEGTRLITGSDGLAEVEFENQSALRLTENSEVKFSQLLMNDAGSKVNQITVVKGLVYLDAAAKGDDIYRVSVDGATLVARHDTLMRLDATSGRVQVAVLKGEVQLENQPQPVAVKKNETLTLGTSDAAGYTIAKGTEAVRFDNWNRERQDYSKTYADNQGYGGPSRGYGLQDLNYYGDFFYANGYGYVWQPYGFASAMTSWDPYSNGAWLSYPGMGYAWASSYPWGWLPYHYGSWAFINGAGWAWVPGSHYGNQWYASNFTATPKVLKAPAGWTAAAPPRSTAANAPAVLVGKAATTQASIPGGRIPPTFGSVIPGHKTGANALHGYAGASAARTASNHSVFASPADSTFSAAHHGALAHVFAAPTPRVAFADAEEIGPHGGAGRAVGASPAIMPSASSAHSSVGSSAAAAHK